MIDTPKAIESINAQSPKTIKTSGEFPTDVATTSLIWLALQKITANRGRAAHGWKSAVNVILAAIRYQRALKTESPGPSKKKSGCVVHPSALSEGARRQGIEKP